MCKLKSICFLSILAILQISAQDLDIIGDSICLDSSYSNINITANAYEWIVLQPGFVFEGGVGNSFSAKCLIFDNIDTANITGGNPDPAISNYTGADGIVGAIPANFSVSSTGSAMYHIPINCPEGIKGLTPQIALSYNSQSGNGDAGWGWNISGLSSIWRTPKTIEYDGVAKEIQWDATDPLVLDGMRLIYESIIGTDKYFRLENDPGTKIIYKGFSDPINSTIDVYDGTGSKYEYHPQLLSVVTKRHWDCSYLPQQPCTLTSDKKYKVLYWYLSKVIDPHGNYIKYNYEHEEDEEYLSFYEMNPDYIDSTFEKPIKDFRISSIGYGSSSEKFYDVVFGYETKNDSVTNFVGGTKIKETFRLNKVEIFYDSTTLLHTYNLNYKGNDQSYLQSVSLSAGSGTNMNKTYFVWEDKTGSVTSSDAYTFSQPSRVQTWASQGYTVHSGITLGDLDGDKDSDFILRYDCYKFVEGGPLEHRSCIAAYINTGSSTTLTSFWDIEIDFMDFANANSHFILDSDNNKDEIFVEEFHSSGIKKYKCYEYNEATSNMVNISASDLEIDITGYTSQSKFEIIPGNFTGYESTDYILIQDDDKHYLYNDGETTELSMGPSTTNNLKINDFNGNGKVDISLINSSGKIEIWELNDNNTSLYRIITGALDYHLDSYEVADFNGDGYADILGRNNSQNSWKIFYSTGDYFIESDMELPVQLCSYLKYITLLDVTRDGKADIIQSYNNAFHLFINTGNGFEQKIYQTGLPDSRVSSLGYLNGDEILDLFFSEDLKYIDLTAPDSYDVITEITNGIGRQRTINFGYEITMLSNLIQSVNDVGGTAQSTTISLKNYLKTVSSVESEGTKNNYSYSEPKLKVNERGFLGFKKFEKEFISGDQSVKETQISNLHQRGAGQRYTLLPDTLRSYINNTQVSEITREYDTKNLNYDTIFLVTKQTETDLVKNNIIVTESYNHNNYLSPEAIVRRYYQNTSDLVATDSSVITFTSTLNPTFHIINVPDLIINYKKRPGENEFIIHKEFDFNTDGTLEYSYIEKDSAHEVRTYLQYDNNGNVTSKTVSASNDSNIPAGKRNRTTTITYTNDKRFPEIITNPLGYTQRLVFDHAKGVLKSKTDDQNNLTTTYWYDDFGALLKTVNPDNTVLINGSRWAESNEDAPSNALFYTFEQSKGSDPVLRFFDIKGNNIRSVTTGFDGRKIYHDKVYSVTGRDSIAYMPYYKGGTASQSTKYFYDDLGRPNNIIYPDGRFTSFTYSGRITTMKNGNGPVFHRSKTTSNALGEVVISEDDDGHKVNTYYHSNGLPKEMVMNNSSHKVEMEYDFYGNKTKIIDPNTGTITSTYDAFGQLISHTNARNLTTEYDYDIGGRIIDETLDGNTKTYSYYETSGFIGSLKKIEQTSPSHSIEFNYDALGRVNSKVEHFDSRLLTTEFSYDFLGRLNSIVYPDSGDFTINHQYNEFGYLKRITTAGYTLWECDNINVLGMITGYNQGSVASEISYDQYGILQSQDLHNSSKVYNYGFDDFMNMSYREDASENLKEQFIYDDLNRLTASDYYEDGSHISKNLEMAYDDNGYGNIISKSDVGAEINYGENAGPNALTSIYNLNQNYRPAPQHITYTAFNKLETLIDTLDNGDTLTLSIDYGLDNQRRKSVLTQPSTGNKTKYFFGNYEIISDDNGTKEYIFINSPTGLSAVVEFYNDNGIRKKKIWHTYSDHLSSLVYLENADNPSETLNYSYDAWGNPRRHSDWLNDDPLNELIADRGYTGHEHLTEFGLINMNGRVYDPKLGRFLSPDPFVQSPGRVGGFNRYAYVMNNPLKYTDPSGYVYQGPVEPEAPYWTPDGTMISIPHQGIIPSGGYSVGTVDWLGTFDVAFDRGSLYRASYGINKGFRHHYVTTDYYSVAYLPETVEVNRFCYLYTKNDLKFRYFFNKDFSVLRWKNPDYNRNIAANRGGGGIDEIGIDVNYGFGYGYKTPFGSAQVKIGNAKVWSLKYDNSKIHKTGFMQDNDMLMLSYQRSIPLLNLGFGLSLQSESGINFYGTYGPWNFGTANGLIVDGTYGIHFGIIGAEGYIRTSDTQSFIQSIPNARQQFYETTGFMWNIR